jgi:uncharacterized protein with von Willebrand factor type A (vWA) domain
MVGNDVPIDVLLDRTVQQLEHAEAVNAQLRAALEKATGRIATLPPDSMGITYTDEKQMLYIRNELLKEMGQVLAATRPDPSVGMEDKE